MSVPLVLIIVTLMLSVQTLAVASPVHVTWDILEMDLPAWVIVGISILSDTKKNGRPT